MTKEQIDQLIDMNCDKLASEFIPQIRERLENVDEGVAQAAFSNLKGGTLKDVRINVCSFCHHYLKA